MKLRIDAAIGTTSGPCQLGRAIAAERAWGRSTSASPTRSHRRALALAALCASIVSACAGSGSGFGLTRDASNEGRRSLEIDCVGSLVFSADGRYMASSDGRTLRVRKSPSGRPHESFSVRGEHGNGGACLAFSPDGSWLASSADGDAAVVIVDVRAWKEHASHRLDGGRVGAIAFSSDGAEIAVGNAIGSIELVDASSGKRRVLRKPRSAAGESAPVSFLAYAGGDRTLIANVGDEMISIDGARADVLWSKADERALAVARDGRRAITVSTLAGTARLVDLNESEAPATLCTIRDPAAPSAAESAVFAPDGAWIGVAFGRGFAGTHWQQLVFYRLVPATPGAENAGEKLRAEEVRTLRAGEPRHISVSPDGKLLCLCTTPIAAIYEIDQLFTKDEL